MLSSSTLIKLMLSLNTPILRLNLKDFFLLTFSYVQVRKVFFIPFATSLPFWISNIVLTKPYFLLNVIQHSVTPEIAVHGLPVDHFSRSGSGGVNLCRFSAGVDFNEPSTSNWSNTTSIKFEVFISYHYSKNDYCDLKHINLLKSNCCCFVDVTSSNWRHLY